jgi:hypothetical protein
MLGCAKLFSKRLIEFTLRSISLQSVVLLNVLTFFVVNAGPAMQRDEGQINKNETVQGQAIELLLKARQVAAELPSSDEPDVVLGDVALDLAKLGETLQARRTFAIIKSDSWSDFAQMPFLEIQLQAQDFAGAQLTVEAMRTPQGKALALLAVASAQWINRKSDASRDTYAARRTLAEAEKIYAEHRAELTNAVFVGELVLTQDELGLGESAGAIRTKRTLAKLSGGDGFSECKWHASWIDSESEKFRAIARAQTQHGDFEAAQSNLRAAADSIETVPTAGDRAILLNMIASDQVNAHDLDGARSSFARAVERALLLPEGNLGRNLIIRDIARDQASAGDIEGSLVTAAQISYADLRDQALGGIALAEVEQVGLEAGLRIAAQITTEEEFDYTLMQIAEYLGKRRDASAVVSVVDKIHSPRMKAVGLEEAAEAMIEP